MTITSVVRRQPAVHHGAQPGAAAAGRRTKSRVALVGCGTYDYETVRRAVRQGLELIGGAGGLVRAGERIVMKPNVLCGTHPDEAVSTHPSVFKAMGELLMEFGAQVRFGDSPSLGRSDGHMRKAGLKRAAEEIGIEAADFDRGRSVSRREGLLMKSFVIANGVLDSDGLVNLAKLKAHPLVRLTGAVKNQFGCIPGLLKRQYHIQLPDPYDFARMLVDLNMLTRPRFCVTDGILAMEGDGPRSGKPRKVNVLLFSRDPVAVDATACRIVNLDPEVVPTSKAGEEAGLGVYNSQDIELVGDGLEAFFCRDFDVIRTPPEHVRRSGASFVKSWLCERPAVDVTKCSRCGACIKMCPVEPKALGWRRRDGAEPPRHQYNLCIRCYCCQEGCPAGAISAHRPVMGRVFYSERIYELYRRLKSVQAPRPGLAELIADRHSPQAMIAGEDPE